VPDWEGRVMLTELERLAQRKDEPLCQELEARLATVESGLTFVQHPLVHAIYLPGTGYMLNDQFRAKEKALDQAMRRGNWHQFVFLHERPYRSRALAAIREYMPIRSYWELVATVWTDAENIWQWGDVETRAMLSGKGRFWLMSGEERLALRDMPKSLRIYRGFHSPGTAAGWSWTLKRDRAEWFASRLLRAGDTPQVAVGTVSRGRVIALLTSRGEDEIVVDPAVVFGTKEAK